MTQRFVIGLIGVGRIGAMHAQNLMELKELFAERGIELELRITDVAREHALKICEQVQARYIPSAAELFVQGLDACIITTGTATHEELIRQAVAHGVPVFCEKPLTLDSESSAQLVDDLADSGAKVQLGFQRRFDPGYLEARRRLREGELGWLHTVRAITADRFPPPVEFLARSGGLFRDCAVHDFDILRWLTGREVIEVYARGSNNGDPAIGAVGDVDSGVALLTFDDGLTATVHVTRYNGAGHDVRLELQGSRTAVMVGLDDSYATASAEPGYNRTAHPHETFMERFDRAYRQELVAFIEFAQGTRENPCTPAEALAAALIADAAQVSLETGQAVRVGQQPVVKRG